MLAHFKLGSQNIHSHLDGLIEVLMLRKYFQQLVDEPGRGPGRLFAWFIQITIIVSIIDFTFESIPDLDRSTLRLLHLVELVSIAVFTIELVLRVAFSKLGWRYLYTFFGIIDVVAILPFYLALGLDLRSVRAFRLLRLFRLFKLARYSQAMQRYHVAFRYAREELLLFGATALIIIYVAGVGIHYFESVAQPERLGSIPQCLWWAVTSLTTVGYGDAYPITVGGKLFTFVILAVGLATVAVPSGIMASALTHARKKVKNEKPESDS